MYFVIVTSSDLIIKFIVLQRYWWQPQFYAERDEMDGSLLRIIDFVPLVTGW